MLLWRRVDHAALGGLFRALIGYRHVGALPIKCDNP
jgi:hypothetical protein